MALGPGVERGRLGELRRPGLGPPEVQLDVVLEHESVPSVVMQAPVAGLTSRLGVEGTGQCRQLRRPVGLLGRGPGRLPGQQATTVDAGGRIGQPVGHGLKRADGDSEGVPFLHVLHADLDGPGPHAGQGVGHQHQPLIPRLLEHPAHVGARCQWTGAGPDGDVGHREGPEVLHPGARLADGQRPKPSPVDEEDLVGHRPGRHHRQCAVGRRVQGQGRRGDRRTGRRPASTWPRRCPAVPGAGPPPGPPAAAPNRGTDRAVRPPGPGPAATPHLRRAPRRRPSRGPRSPAGAARDRGRSPKGSAARTCSGLDSLA